jgi:hypothetical protein
MLSAAATAETAKGWGSTSTASSGVAPNRSPSPELARLEPTQSRAKWRLRRCLAFLAMRISQGNLPPGRGSSRRTSFPGLTSDRGAPDATTGLLCLSASAFSLKAEARRADIYLAAPRRFAGVAKTHLWLSVVLISWVSPISIRSRSFWFPPPFAGRYGRGNVRACSPCHRCPPYPRGLKFRWDCNLLATDLWP